MMIKAPMQPTLFNFPETQRLNDLERMMGDMSYTVALIQNQVNSIKKDIADEKKRKLYDQM